MKRVKARTTQPRDYRTEMLHPSVEYLDSVHFRYSSCVFGCRVAGIHNADGLARAPSKASRRRVAIAVSLTTPLVNRRTSD